VRGRVGPEEAEAGARGEVVVHVGVADVIVGLGEENRVLISARRCLSTVKSASIWSRFHSSRW
jgi:hypothetical protein